MDLTKKLVPFVVTAMTLGLIFAAHLASANARDFAVGSYIYVLLDNQTQTLMTPHNVGEPCNLRYESVKILGEIPGGYTVFEVGGADEYNFGDSVRRCEIGEIVMTKLQARTDVARDFIAPASNPSEDAQKFEQAKSVASKILGH